MPKTKHFSLPLLPRPATLKSLFEALFSERVSLAGMQTTVPGPLPIRLAVVLSNLRMQRMFDRLIQRGETVVDVGANIGYNTLYAAHRVGPKGRVYAIEPAQDNLAILYANLYANHLQNVVVLPYAAGSTHEIKQFFLRGDVSAVNSLYQDNFYHPITKTVEVLAAPLDDLIPGTPALVKIDVEGGELEVLQGMSRILRSGSLRLIVEWHPTLQEAAGHAPDALPRRLKELGFKLRVVTHTKIAPLHKRDLPTLTAHLLDKRSPVELLALRPK
jgi:FkbM family methyltransferase